MKFASPGIALFVAMMVISCSSGTGGIIGNLIPAPKFLDGEVKGGKYFSPDDSFNVRLPHPPESNDRDNYEWLYTQIHEIKDGPVIGIVLGPAAFDRNIYHAVLIRKPGTPNNETMEDYAKNVFKTKSESRKRNLVLKHYSQSAHNGKQLYYAVYSGNSSYLVLSLTENGDSFYVMEADILEDSTMDNFTSVEQLINKEWSIFNTMYDSFTVTNASYKP